MRVRISKSDLDTIRKYERTHGRARAISFAQGYLGIRKGNYGRSVPTLRKILNKKY